MKELAPMKSKARKWRRFRMLILAAAVFTIAGFFVRFAEDSQVGYTNDTSMWMFGIAGIFAWLALLQLVTPSAPGNSSRTSNSEL